MAWTRTVRSSQNVGKATSLSDTSQYTHGDDASYNAMELMGIALDLRF